MLLIIGIIIALVAVVAAIVSATYSSSVSSKMALGDDAAASALVAPASDSDAYYVLIAADLQSSDQTGYDGASALDLVRIDPNGPSVALLGIPGNLQTTLPDGEVAAIGSEQPAGGDEGLIKEVADYVGVDIAHYVKVDSAGLSAIVDDLGGIDVDVPEEVDDPNITTTYLAAGQQTLDGQQAVALATAANYSDGSTRKAQNNMLVLQSIVSKLSALSGLDQKVALDHLADNIKTDYTADGLSDVLQRLSGFNESTAISCTVPGSDSRNDDDMVEFYSSSSSWSKVQAAFTSGQDPAAATAAAVAQVDPSKFSVEVKNGAGQTGAASQAAKKLKQAGYTVTGTGNTDQAVYTETLVVYKKKSSKTAAQAVASTLGAGRAVSASIYYSFDADLEVIIGSDYSTD